MPLPHAPAAPGLWPPLAEIERDVNGATAAADELVASAESSAPALAGLPLALRHKIEAAERARSAIPQSPQRVPGNIVSLAVIDASGAPTGARVGFLLDAPASDAASADVWQGWIVAGEPDYAGPWDVLLDEGDGPSAPSLAMIQTWNRIAVRIPEPTRVLGRLSAPRLDAVREVAWESAGGACRTGGKPVAGRVGVRTNASKSATAQACGSNQWGKSCEGMESFNP